MKILGMILLTIGMNSAFAMNKVIYGNDDRLDIPEVVNGTFLDVARSTAAMIPDQRITLLGDMVSVDGPTLQSMGICSDERFANQPTAANCSGFLVADDLLVTAGHCMQSESDCSSSTWVFDFNTNFQVDGKFQVPTSSVYRCQEIVAQQLDRYTKLDFAIIRLNRKVTDRAPLSIRREGKIELDAPIVVIGHPTGLPTKVASGAFVRENGNPVFFNANLDTFGGNSGSAVFSVETGKVEGILVRGEVDYVYSAEKGCRVPKVCGMSECRGEDVTRIEAILQYVTE